MQKNTRPPKKKKVRFDSGHNILTTFSVDDHELGIRNSPIYQSLDNWHVIYKPIEPDHDFPIASLQQFIRSNDFIQSQDVNITFPYNLQLSPIETTQGDLEKNGQTRFDELINQLDNVIFDQSESYKATTPAKLFILLHQNKHLVERYCNSLTTDDRINMRPFSCVIFLRYDERSQSFSLLLHKFIRDKHQPPSHNLEPCSDETVFSNNSNAIQSPRPIRVTALPPETTPSKKTCGQHTLGLLKVVLSTVMLTGVTTFLNSQLTKQINDPSSNKDYIADYMVNLFFCNLPATFVESILFYLLQTCKPRFFTQTPTERIPLLSNSIQRYDDICVSPNSRMECSYLFYTLMCCGLLPYTAYKPLAILLHQPPKVDKNPLSNAICMMVITLGFTLTALFINRVAVYCQQKKKKDDQQEQQHYYYASHFSSP